MPINNKLKKNFKTHNAVKMSIVQMSIVGLQVSNILLSKHCDDNFIT